MSKMLRRRIFIFLVIYISCFLYSFFVSTVYNDEIWNYGVAYNISLGMIPYRDFNLVTTPLYPMLASIFIKLFGNYLYSFHLFNSLIMAGIIYIFWNRLKYKSFIIIPFIFLNCYPGYNILSIFIILLLINSLDKKFYYYDFFVGLLVAFMFLTKQTIGILLLIPMLFYSNNKLKAIIGFLIPIFLIFIYLVMYNSFYEFIDYCFLGLFDFGNSNKILLFFPVVLVICIIMFYKLFKSNFEKKELFYLLMYQVVTVPIFDDYHFMIGFIPVLYYLLLKSDIDKYKIKYYFIISLFIFFCWNFFVHDFNTLNFYSDKNSYLYGRNVPSYVEINNISDYIEENKKNYNHIYFFSKNAYYVKLNTSYGLDKYDMICNGNMGYNGANKYIKEINDYCSNNSCLFILYKYEFSNNITQTNKNLVDYVKKNYDIYDEIDVFDIYVN